MEDTFQIKAIVLKREPFRENDVRVIVYSLEKGRMDLVARGAKKIKSKMAGHLEPMTMVNLMVVKGKQWDYIGSATSERSFAGVKADLDKTMAAGFALNFFLDVIKPAEADAEVFALLSDFLDNLENKDTHSSLLAHFFILKLSARLGYEPELFNCISCRTKITPQGNRFSHTKGGVACPTCAHTEGEAVSDDTIKLLRLVLSNDFATLSKIRVNDTISVETTGLVGSFVKYNLV